jgi:hypothetical protein
MPRQVTTFLMFEGAAEEAMTLYASVFARCEIRLLERYEAGEQGPAGKVKRAPGSSICRKTGAILAFPRLRSIRHEPRAAGRCPLSRLSSSPGQRRSGPRFHAVGAARSGHGF